MATRLFYRTTNFDTASFPGTYPTTSGQLQAVVPNPQPVYTRPGADALSVNRSLKKTKGTTTTSYGISSQGVSGNTQTNYIGKFISDPLKNVTQINANSWSCLAAKLQTHANSVYGGALLALYVWRPSTGARVGGQNIFDWGGEGGFGVPTTINTIRLSKGNVTSGTGRQITGVQNNDVLIVELYNRKTQSNATVYVDRWYHDGANEHAATANQTIVSDVASYIETPQDLEFVTDHPNEIEMSTTSANLVNKFITKA